MIPGLGRSHGEGEWLPTPVWASLVAQLVKISAFNAGYLDLSHGWEDPLEKGKAALSSILAWRIPWGRKELDTTERLSLTTLPGMCVMITRSF